MTDTLAEKPSHKEAKASAKAEKAHAKALRPWYRKKRSIAGLGVAAILGIIAISGGGGSDDAGSGTTSVASEAATGTTPTESSARLFPGRADAQKEDQEREIGGEVRLSGYTTAVTGAAYQAELSMFEDEGYLVADVTVANRDQDAQSYNTFDWKLQTPSGQVVDPTFGSVDQLGSGDLVSGGQVAGKVLFEVGSEKGDFYVIYKPDPFDAARGIWKVTL